VVVAIRLSQGRSPFHADKQHLSHRLVAREWSSVAAVRIIHLLALASGLVSLAFFELTPAGALTLALVLAAAWLAGAVFEFFSWRRRGRDAAP
jgi:UDP-GlcNAc:undecaprenyl-phosphate GlcNAc-1-phosphate transferase